MVWRKYQQQNKTKNNLRLAFAVLGLLVTLILIAKLISIFGSLYQPFNSGIASNKKYAWDGVSSINTLIYYPDAKNIEPSLSDSKLALISLQPESNRIIVLYISDDIYATLPKGYGDWKVGSIYKLGLEQGGETVSSKLLELSISKLVGLPVDGLIISSSQSEDFSIKKEIESWRKNPLTTLAFVRQIKTDMTPIELINFIKKSASIRSDKITSLNLAQSNITESMLLPDSSRVLGINTIKMDNFIREQMADNLLVGEGENVAIFNGSDHPGLAQEASRLLTNMGFNVISFKNTEQPVKQSQVEYRLDGGNSKDKSRAFQRIAQIFAPSCLNKICQIEDIRVNSSRAQINVVLGEDYYNLWYKQ